MKMLRVILLMMTTAAAAHAAVTHADWGKLPDGSTVTFPIDEFARYCMLQGVDELGYILQLETEIAAYESQRTLSINTLSES